MEKADEQSAQRDYLRAVLAKTGWTPTRLARAARLAPSTINRFLKDETVTHALKAQTLSAVAEASGVPLPVELLGGGHVVAVRREREAGPEVLTLDPATHRALGRAERAAEEDAGLEAASLPLDSSVLLRFTRRYFRDLKRDRSDWSVEEKATEFVSLYVKLIVRGRTNECAET